MRHSVLFATAFATLISTQTFAADLPGKGITVNPVQSTITEETFQTLLVSRALEKSINPAKWITTLATPRLLPAMQPSPQ